MPSRRSDRLDRYQRTHRWLGFPVAVLYKVFDDRAPYLAALITYYAFVSLFPLILLFASISGFVLQGDPGLRNRIVNAAVSNLPAIGSEIRSNIGGFRGSTAGLIVGMVGLLYGALGAMQAAQAAFNHIYAVPRFRQPNPIRSRVRSLGLLLLLGTAIVVSSGINLLISTGNGISQQIGTDLKVLGFALSAVISVALFTGAFQLLTAVDLKWHEVVRGGAIAGGSWELLQAFGSRYVVHEVHHGSALYGVFGVVLAAIAWIYLVALTVMVSAEINVVQQRHLWPRSLFTPFADDVELTDADRVAYAGYARARRFKSWQGVDVVFDDTRREGDPPPPPP